MDIEVEGIVVEGYSARYAAAVDKLLEEEGGYVDDPADRGGATKFGISLRFLAADGAFDEDGDGKKDFDLDFDGDIDGKDIRLLTLGDARFLYLKRFWRPLHAESLPSPIGEMMFDQAVNGGLVAAQKGLQKALNAVLAAQRYRSIPLAVDGHCGPTTRSLLNDLWPRHGAEIVDRYRDAVKERYLAIVRRNPDQAKFLRGWLNSAEGLGR